MNLKSDIHRRLTCIARLVEILHDTSFLQYHRTGRSYLNLTIGNRMCDFSLFQEKGVIRPSWDTSLKVDYYSYSQETVPEPACGRVHG
jgi:hypothetical protein